MTILGKIDNGEHLNIDRGPYFDHDERDQLLRHFTILKLNSGIFRFFDPSNKIRIIFEGRFCFPSRTLRPANTIKVHDCKGKVVVYD